MKHAEEHKTSVISQRVPWAQVASYGVADINTDTASGSFPVADFVVKPPRDDAPSNFAITGRYIFTPDIFEALAATEKGINGELQLTDALQKLDAIRGVGLRGDRYDIDNTRAGCKQMSKWRYNITTAKWTPLSKHFCRISLIEPTFRHTISRVFWLANAVTRPELGQLTRCVT